MTNRDLDINGPEDFEGEGIVSDAFAEDLTTADDLERAITGWLDLNVEPSLPLIEHGGWQHLQDDIDASVGTAELFANALRMDW